MASTNGVYKRKLHHVEKIDLTKMLLIIVGFVCVKWMNVSAISGFVRQETLVKLKILFTLLEVLPIRCVRLFCSHRFD
jgi:hypothetical protein